MMILYWILFSISCKPIQKSRRTVIFGVTGKGHTDVKLSGKCFVDCIEGAGQGIAACYGIVDRAEQPGNRRKE